ncbi:hypothetical protein BDY17DRAFT_292510 [Neohortaea acidophila]|uniref:Uncharacterized protein n=1 Tax=Neohortaea acidophila TaxID=245834 RepID=A0A6A6PZJ9_9PEZI|nr:uncharacterized protein BDY17DRAFT_292510 [Neohortaea acidophila]KAF2484863.1 hypothetical protein BDY17DRAFT_292510 [Neohortaea acidophila]
MWLIIPTEHSGTNTSEMNHHLIDDSPRVNLPHTQVSWPPPHWPESNLARRLTHANPTHPSRRPFLSPASSPKAEGAPYGIRRPALSLLRRT